MQAAATDDPVHRRHRTVVLGMAVLFLVLALIGCVLGVILIHAARQPGPGSNLVGMAVPLLGLPMALIGLGLGSIGMLARDLLTGRERLLILSLGSVMLIVFFGMFLVG